MATGFTFHNFRRSNFRRKHYQNFLGCLGGFRRCGNSENLGYSHFEINLKRKQNKNLHQFGAVLPLSYKNENLYLKICHHFIAIRSYYRYSLKLPWKKRFKYNCLVKWFLACKMSKNHQSARFLDFQFFISFKSITEFLPN